MNIPNYVTKESTNGFNCEIVLNSKIFSANGVSKRTAEIATAKKALLHLKSDNG